MKNYKKAALSVGFVLLGVGLAFASKVLFPIEFNNFWRILIELCGYGLIAVGVYGFCRKEDEKTER